MLGGVSAYVLGYSLVTVTILEPPQHIRGRHFLTGVNTQPAHEVPSVFPMRLGGGQGLALTVTLKPADASLPGLDTTHEG